MSVFTLLSEVFFLLFSLTQQYFAILSSTRQAGKVTLFSAASSLYRQLIWFVNSHTSRQMILSLFPLVDFYYMFSLQQAKCQIFAEH